jgi:RNA polymerase sigma-70 factor (ECF subfamily)
MKNKKNDVSLHKLGLMYKDTKCERVFNQIYNKLEYPLFEHIYKILRDVENSKIVRQRTFEKLFLNIDGFNPSYKFTTWIYGIAKNEAYYFYKTEKKDRLIFLGNMLINDDIEDYGTALDMLFDEDVDNNYLIDNYLSKNEYMQNEDNEFENLLLSKKYGIAIECIECLPEQYSVILKDKYMHNMKQKEIAEKYSINFNTVKTRIFNATQNIKIIYKDKINKVLVDIENGRD